MTRPRSQFEAELARRRRARFIGCILMIFSAAFILVVASAFIVVASWAFG